MDRSAIFQPVAAGTRSRGFGGLFAGLPRPHFSAQRLHLFTRHHRHSFLDRFHLRPRPLCADVAHPARYGLRVSLKLSASSSHFYFREGVRRRRRQENRLVDFARHDSDESVNGAAIPLRARLFHSFRGRSIMSPVRPLSCSTAAFVVRVMAAGCFSAPVAAFSWQLLFREVVRWWFPSCWLCFRLRSCCWFALMPSIAS